MQNERYNFIILVCVVFSFAILNYFRINSLETAVVAGTIVSGSLTDAVYLYVASLIMDAAAFEFIRRNPDYWVKGTSKQIMGCFVAAAISHAVGFGCWAADIYFLGYLIIADIVFALEMAILLMGGYGVFRRHKNTGLSNHHVVDPTGNVVPVVGGIDDKAPGRR